jgi:predicted RNase H-like HicB family nuclease
MVKNSEIIFVIEEAVEGGYTARSLGASIFTEGETLSEVKVNIKDAIACHFEDDEMPKIIRLHIVKDELLTV